MTNEAMAYEIIQDSEYLKDDFGKAYFDCEMAEKMLMRMAEWKDQKHAKDCESLVGLAVKESRRVFIDKACEIVLDFANEHFGDWEQSCKFEDKFRKAMESNSPEFEGIKTFKSYEELNEHLKKLDEMRGEKSEIPTLIGKACEWLANQYDYADEEYLDDKIQEFRKAMESNYGEFATIKTCNSDKNLQELTWQDVAKIWRIGMYIADYNSYHNIPIENEAFFKEILNQYINDTHETPH